MTREEYQNRVLGCFVGKNIGGTLGMPMEWERSKNDVTYYTHDITGDPLPNDDLDIQILWLLALEEQGLHIDSKILGQYFNEYMIFTHAEYGVAKTNLRAGLQPPVTGTFHNKFKDSCGSYIRSDIWACLFPGNPEKAAEYAFEDALVDHGNGEGVYAEVFMAAMESAAFYERDIRKLIDNWFKLYSGGMYGKQGNPRCNPYLRRGNERGTDKRIPDAALHRASGVACNCPRG